MVERFSKFVGNSNLLSLLCNGSLPSSTIFSGPDGIGKKTAALLLAAKTNCKDPAGGDPCGNCSSCIKARSGNHPDIVLLPAEEATIKIGSIRHLNQEVQYRPFEGKARFFIIDEAERMTLEAANALLKTLEEPPPSSYLILVTAYPETLLSTIQSRCQKFVFQPLKREEIQVYLERSTELDRPELRAAFAQGSLGNALSIELDEVLAQRDLMLELLKGWWHDRRFQRVFELVESNSLRARLKKREQTADLLEHLQTLCYDLYYLIVGTRERVVNIDRIPDLEKEASRASLETVRKFLEHVLQSKKDLDRYVNPLMVFEAVWLEDLRGNLT